MTITDKMVEAALAAYVQVYRTPEGLPLEAMRAALEAAEQAAWEPIEEAPKPDGDESGEPMLVAVIDRGVQIAAQGLANYWDVQEDGAEPRYEWNGRHEYYDADLPATHYRPLPKGPEQ